MMVVHCGNCVVVEREFGKGYLQLGSGCSEDSLLR